MRPCWTASHVCPAQNFDGFLRGLLGFAGVAVPAAVVNAGLKYMQKRLQLAFMRRLTHHLHTLYCSNRAYYAASVLGGDCPSPWVNQCRHARR